MVPETHEPLPDLPDPADPEPAPAVTEPVHPAAEVSSAGSLRTLALGFYGIVTLFAVGYALFSTGLPALFGERAPSWIGVSGAVGLGVGIVLLSRVAARVWKSVAAATDALAEMLGPVRWPDALFLACISGVAEELLFRGALWHHLDLVGTTLLFGLVHVLPKRSLWVYPIFATGAGLVLGLLREGTGSVWPPVIAHVTVNGINLVWLGRRARRSLPGEPAP